MASRPIGYWIGGGSGDASPESYLDGSPVDRNVFLLLILGGVFVLRGRRVNWRLFRNQNFWLICYYVFCGISILWSEYPFVTFKRWFKEIGTVVMVLVIMTDRDPIKAFQEVFVRCAFLLIPTSILVIKYYLDVGRT